MVNIDGICYPYKKFKRYLDISRALIHRCNSNFKHFSFLVNKSKIISIGFNDVDRPSKLVQYPLGGRHSESDAFSGLRDLNIIKNCTMVNIRINNQGKLRNSCPCPICKKFLTNIGLRKMYHSTNTSFEEINLR